MDSGKARVCEGDVKRKQGNLSPERQASTTEGASPVCGTGKSEGCGDDDYNDGGTIPRVPAGRILHMPPANTPSGHRKRPSCSDTESLSSLSSIAEELDDLKSPHFELNPKSDKRVAWTHVDNDHVVVSPRRKRLVLRALSKVGHPHVTANYQYTATNRVDGNDLNVATQTDYFNDNKSIFGDNIVKIPEKKLVKDIVVGSSRDTKRLVDNASGTIGIPVVAVNEKVQCQRSATVISWYSSVPKRVECRYRICPGGGESAPRQEVEDSASTSSTSSADTVLETSVFEEKCAQEYFESLEWHFDDIENELIIPCPIEFESETDSDSVSNNDILIKEIIKRERRRRTVSDSCAQYNSGTPPSSKSSSSLKNRSLCNLENMRKNIENQPNLPQPNGKVLYTDGTEVTVMNTERHKVRIPFSSLPRTYKDNTGKQRDGTAFDNPIYQQVKGYNPMVKPPPPPRSAVSDDERSSSNFGIGFPPPQGPRPLRSQSVSSLRKNKGMNRFVESHEPRLKVPPSPPLRSVIRGSRSTPDFTRTYLTSSGKRVSFGDIRLGQNVTHQGMESVDTSSTLQPPISATICASPKLRPKLRVVDLEEGDLKMPEFPPEMEDFSDHDYRIPFLPRDIFITRGALSEPGNTFSLAQTHQNSSLDFTPTPDFPALQYLDRVDKGSMADKAGLKPSDFVLEINGESVVNATHEHTVELIKRSGDTLAMRVITVKPLSTEGHERDIHMDGTRTLPLKKKALAPAPPKRHPHTSLTNSVAGKAKTMIDSLAELDRLDRTLALYDDTDSRSVGPMQSSSALDSAAIRRGVDPNNKTASIRSRHSGKRLTAFEIEGMFADQAALSPKPVVVVPPKTYASPTEQKVARMKGRIPANANGSLSRARSTPSLVPGSQGSPLTSHPHHVTRVVIQDGGAPDDGRVMYESPASSPGYQSINGPDEALYAVPMKPKMSHREESPVYAETGIPPHPRDTPPRPPSSQGSHYSGDSIPPPPTHPPPVPPTRSSSQAGEVVKINTSSPTYANVSQQIQQQQAMKRQTSIESSFRPGAAARMSKEPAVLPPTSQVPRLNNSVSSSSTMSSASDHYAPTQTNVHRTEQHVITSTSTTTQDSVHENARRFMQEDASSPSLVAAASHGRESQHPPPPTSRAQYYEPEPDYDIVTREQAAAKEVIRQSPVTVISRQSPSPAVNRHSPSPVVSRQSQSPAASQQSPASSTSRNSASPAASRQTPIPANYRRSPSVERTPEVVLRHVEVEQRNVKVEEDVPSVQSIREAWQTKQVKKSFDETDKTVVASPKPGTPKQEENSMSAFGNAIRAAAVAREIKKDDIVNSPKVEEAPPKKAPTPPPPPPFKKQSTPPPPPPPGPPPPILSSTPPSSQPPTIRKNHLPPHVQKSLEENRQREDTHAAIMAAVARRRNIVENENMEKVADNIENKVQKAKKLQSTVYKSDNKKEVISPQPNNGKGALLVQENKPFKKAPTPPPKSTTVESSVRTTEVIRSEAVRMEAKQDKAQKPPEETKSLKPSQEASIVTTEVKSMEPTNFTAMAEKARQEYLQKKTGQTLERKKKQSTGDDGSKSDEQEEDNDNNNVNKKTRAPPPPAKPDRNGFGGNHTGNGNGNGNGSPSSSGIADLATIIAQKAAARQKSYDAVSDNSTSGSKSNGNVGNGYQHTPTPNMAPMGVNTNSNNRNSALTAGSRQSVEIHGATLDSSNTEMLERNEENQAKALGSVLQRTQIFESQKAMLKKTPTSTGSKTVYRGDGSRTEGPLLPPAAFGDDLPPPMVPPPSSSSSSSNLDIVSNGHGQETVGWVINSSPSKHTHEYAIRSKTSPHRINTMGMDGEGGDVATVSVTHEFESPVAEVYEVDFIPPPPLFDSPEMNALVGTSVSAAQAHHEETASMVSSVSTLSTLSSTEQETGSPRQSYRASYTMNKDNDNAPPPPPGFGDILDPPLEEVPGAGFIPPPLGFEVAGSLPEPVSGHRTTTAFRNGSYQNKPIGNWSTADVCEWLDSIQLGALKVNFSKNKVTGQKLIQMGRNELMALGVTSVGDRMSIERAIKQAMMNT